MSDCTQGGRRVPLPPLRLRVDFADSEKPWSCPMALNGRTPMAVRIDGVPKGCVVPVFVNRQLVGVYRGEAKPDGVQR